MCRKLFFSLLWVLCLCCSTSLYAQSRPALLPDYATLQYAGSLGLGAAGFGYQNGKRTIESELLLGYLPAGFGGDRLFTAALKSNIVPFRLFSNKPVRLYPFYTGLMIAYTFGDQFFAKPPDQYPKGYYTFSTAIHAYWQFGSRISIPVNNRRLEFYYEFNASAEEIVSMIQNPRFLTPDKIFSLALGIKLNFEP